MVETRRVESDSLPVPFRLLLRASLGLLQKGFVKIVLLLPEGPALGHVGIHIVFQKVVRGVLLLELPVELPHFEVVVRFQHQVCVVLAHVLHHRQGAPVPLLPEDGFFQAGQLCGNLRQFCRSPFGVADEEIHGIQVMVRAPEDRERVDPDLGSRGVGTVLPLRVAVLLRDLVQDLQLLFGKRILVPFAHIEIAHFLQVIVEQPHGQVVETVPGRFHERFGGEDAVSVPKMADGEHLEGGPELGVLRQGPGRVVPGRPEIIPVKEGHGDVGQDHRVPGFQGEGGKVEEEGVIG
ncbi:hypothetical protein SDC9_43491 [bioreactor metagenome]|uniref:Uncharacterized protein n=1 Tax=bioreactor metagenome TaxID=1076179 RepID=A0A644W3L3_9ZZZZ